jgi:hypothetical protein
MSFEARWVPGLLLSIGIPAAQREELRAERSHTPVDDYADATCRRSLPFEAAAWKSAIRRVRACGWYLPGDPAPKLCSSRSCITTPRTAPRKRLPPHGQLVGRSRSGGQLRPTPAPRPLAPLRLLLAQGGSCRAIRETLRLEVVKRGRLGKGRLSALGTSLQVRLPLGPAQLRSLF